MEKSFFEQMGGTYHQQGDYMLPDLAAPENISVGVWGQQHLRYIREYRKALYTSLQLSGRLKSYLADVDQQAQERLDTIIQQMAQAQGINEVLKTADQMAWVGRMNNIRASAIEIVNEEIIYV